MRLRFAIWGFVVAISRLVACGPGVEEGTLPPPAVNTDSAGVDTTSETIADSASESEPGTESDSLEPDTLWTDTAPPDAGESDPEGSDAAETDTFDPDAGELDAGDTDTADTELYNECGSYLEFEHEATVLAETVLPGGQFVAMGDNCLLASRQEENGYTATIAFTNSEDSDKILAAFETTISKEPKAVVCRYSSQYKTATAHVVASDDTSSVVYELVDEIGTWNNVFEGPKLGGARWLVRTEAPSVDKICVFGDGIYCADKSSEWKDWQPFFDVQDSVPIFDMTVFACDEGWCPVAVGQRGSLFIQRQSAWTKIQTGTDSDLTSITDQDGLFVAVGRDGALVFGDESSVYSDVIMEGADIASLYFNSGFYFRGVTLEGTIFDGVIWNRQKAMICPITTTVAGPVIDGMFLDCGSHERFIVLTGDAFIGDYQAEVVIV